MKPKATFNIEGSFKITGRGLVIYGDIIEGKINSGDFISFDTINGMLKLKIVEINFVDRKGVDKISKIGLTFLYNTEKERVDLEILKVTKQIATITDQ